MPYRNRIKDYRAESYYHLYARGVNRQKIFKQKSDYTYFLYLLKKYLSPDFEEKRSINGFEDLFPVNSVSDELILHAYCLMPNHFHLLVYNKVENGIQGLMRRVLTSYVSVFNKKHSREGPLIQGSYRSVLISGEEQLIYASRYIHLNPLKSGLVISLNEYPYSSLKYYIKNKSTKWLLLNTILANATDHTSMRGYLTVLEKKDSPSKDYPL